MRTIWKGSARKSTILKAQKYLGIRQTGIFNRYMKDVVIEFQLRNGLVADGVIGKRSWAKLYANKFQDTFSTDTIDKGFFVSGDIDGQVKLLSQMFKLDRRGLKLLKEGYSGIQPYLKMLKLDTRNRMLHFIAQIREEVGRNITLVENLNYGYKTLPKVFKKFRGTKGLALAKKYGRTLYHRANQVMIANIAYSFRVKNGSVKSGDGWLFRGRGGKMVTFRGNYRKEQEYVSKNLPAIYEAGYRPLQNPDSVASSFNWLLSAAIFWFRNGLYRFADQGINRSASRLITAKVNYYTASYDRRFSHLQKLDRIYA